MITSPGASPSSTTYSVPLEEALNGVENMMYMTSTASNTGAAKITVYFRQGTDPDMATVNVQNRIATAQGLLPAEVTRSGITVRKRQTSNIKALALYSPDSSIPSGKIFDISAVTLSISSMISLAFEPEVCAIIQLEPGCPFTSPIYV